MSGEITLPKFASGATNEEEPTESKKLSGWTDGEEPAAEYLNWIHRRTYESAKATLALGQANVAGKHASLGVAHGAGTPGATYTVEVALWDDDVIILGSDHDGTDIQITTSEDGGLTFTDRYGPTAATIPELGVVSPGRYAIMVADASTWYHAPYPYTSWTLVSSATFTSTKRRRMGLLPIDGEMSVVLTGDGAVTACYLEYTPADTEPTVAGDWTTVTFAASSTFDFYGMDYNDDYMAIAATASSNPYIYYAVTGTGGLVGDWSTVQLSIGSSTLYDVAWTGTRWVAVGTTGNIWLSDGSDILTWVGLGTNTVGGNSLHLTCDRDTGFLYAYADSGDAIHVSRDDGLTWFEAIAGGSNNMGAQGQRLGYDKKRRYLFGGDDSLALEKFIRTL